LSCGFSYNNAPHSPGVLDYIFSFTAWLVFLFLADLSLLKETTVLGAVGMNDILLRHMDTEVSGTAI
jgi:hypothetical protein